MVQRKKERDELSEDENRVRQELLLVGLVAGIAGSVKEGRKSPDALEINEKKEVEAV